ARNVVIGRESVGQKAVVGNEGIGGIDDVKVRVEDRCVGRLHSPTVSTCIPMRQSDAAFIYTTCVYSRCMSAIDSSHALLGLIGTGPSYGYDLKHDYDRLFGGERPLAFGQVYATLARLVKH